MAARLVDNIRRGQAQLSDRMLSDAVVDRGLATATEISGLLVECEAGELGQQLISSGRISSPQLEQLSCDVEVMQMVETIGDESAPLEVQAAAEKQGRRIGRYVLVDQLGAGGMGVVWRAWDSQLSRWIALKVVKVQDARAIRRFMREATLLARLSHSNITRIYEVGVHEGRPFLVMEIVEGGTVGSGPVERKRAAEIVRDAARALQYAHERGMIHRDIKPSNLLQTKEGQIFVTDFGLARMREEQGSLTASGALLGTPSFMAPEQAQGKDADFRTDVYGLGATLFALVEGRAPYTGEIVHEVVKRVAVSTAPSLSGQDDLVVVAQKAMERDREDRYQSAGELADELDRFINDEPIEARKISSIERVWRRARRKPAQSSAIASAALVAMAALVWSTNFAVDYLTRRAQVSAASAPLSQADSVIDKLKKMYVEDRYNNEWAQAALDDLDKLADEALEAAPGYAQAWFRKGLAHMWRGDDEAAVEAFSAALEDDPDHHEARARRALSRFSLADASSPVALHDFRGFRIVPPKPGPEIEAELQPIEEDIALLPPDFDQRVLAESALAWSRGRYAESRAGIEAHLDEQPYDLTARGLLISPILSQGDYDGALEHADRLLALQWFPALTLSMKAFAYAGKEDYENAIAASRQSLEYRDTTDVRRWMAFWLGKIANYDAALAEYTTVIEADPQDDKALAERANIHLILSSNTATPLASVEAAIRDTQAALELNPGNEYAHFLLGQAQLALGRAQPALDSYDAAINLDPDYAVAYTGRSMALGELGRSTEAIAALTRAVELEPDNDGWRDLLARYQLLSGDTDAVEETLQSLPDDNIDGWILRAQARYQGGRIDAALAAINEATTRAPERVDAWVDQGKYQAVAGDIEAASRSFAQAQQRAADGPRVLQGIADGWFQADRNDLALPPARAAAKALPDDAEAQATLALVLSAQQNHADALVAWQRAAELDPAPWYQTSVAEALLLLGRSQEAAKIIAGLIETDPGNADAHSLMAQVHIAESRLADAEREFSRAIELAPSSGYLHAYRSQVRAMLANCAGAEADLQHSRTLGFNMPPVLVTLIAQQCPQVNSLQ
ncbi:MAG: tetratricopeptide repeat protein [Gammaproteobacteria bacterium]|nr:tetratricopeptide repeat protein [Gammaproteobacteria bacterium]